MELRGLVARIASGYVRIVSNGFLVLFLVVLPGLLLLSYSIAFVNINEAVAAVICGGVAVGTYYMLRRYSTASAELSVALSISTLLLTIVLTVPTDGNPYDYVSPYLGAFSVWAITAVMWHEIRRFAARHDFVEDFPPAAVEATGFGVGLLYTAIYALVSVHGPDGPPNELFFGFLVMWLIFRFLGMMQEDVEEGSTT